MCERLPQLLRVVIW